MEQILNKFWIFVNKISLKNGFNKFFKFQIFWVKLVD